MDNFKHTPGLWLREGKTVYALMHYGWRKGVEQFKNRFYASIQADRECSEEEAEANARLIAAAPDLLEALMELVNGSGFAPGDRIEKARAAIAKATGENK